MTFLQLCQRLRQEAGISGTGPSAVTGQTGEMKRVVDWINAAWMDIQIDHIRYDWMKGSFTLTLAGSDAEYAASDASITDLREWDRESLKVYETSTADETELTFVPYDEFRSAYMVGTIPTGRPEVFTVKPDKTMRFWPTPSGTFTVTGEYHKAASEMAADADEPGMPDEFHMAIVYRALQKYARYESAPEIYDDAKEEYRRMRNALRINQTGEMTLGGALA